MMEVGKVMRKTRRFAFLLSSCEFLNADLYILTCLMSMLITRLIDDVTDEFLNIIRFFFMYSTKV